MTPPPTSIDGTDITGATIDGQDVQEITVDGQTVFTAKPPLPPSAIHQYNFDEGSGSTAFDNIGSKDASINGANFTSNSSLVGGFGLSFDGIDDFVDAGSPLNTLLRTGSNDSFSLAITANPGNTNSYRGWIVTSNGNPRTNFGIYDGKIEAAAGDSSFNFTSRQASSIPSGTNRYVMVYRAGPDEVEIYSNASRIDDLGRLDGLGGWDNGIFIGASGPGQQFYDGVLDNPILYDVDLTTSEIQDDFDRQPFS